MPRGLPFIIAQNTHKIHQMLEDMSDDQTDPDPIIAVCQDVEELYLSRAKSEIHKTSLQNRADKVVIVDLEKWGFQDHQNSLYCCCSCCCPHSHIQLQPQHSGLRNRNSGKTFRRHEQKLVTR